MSAGTVSAHAQPAAIDPYLYRIRDLVYRAAGIFHPDTRLCLLADRCGRRMKELQVRTLGDYLERLTQPGADRDEMVKLLNEVTIGETCFFRNQPQLDALKSIVWPRIIAAVSTTASRKLRIWSAGCSTGEEPYTLAIMLLEASPALFKGWTFDIQATDLNERSLEHAQAAIYGDYSTRNLTPYIRQKYFIPVDDRLQVNPAVRKLVTFSRVNLLDNTRMSLLKDMDLIFCANVLIYFDLNSKRTVIRHFFNNLLSNGYFFLGHSESLYGVCDQFKLVHFPSATAYVKVQPQPARK
ncbi:MAG: protein-glutamate O-methyltransferase CheR [Acidobacteriia bacterium]|nr:protein-glutamate O-methyltransferase CheR [Terriglobia bacterium]